MSSAWMFVEDEPDLYEILSALFELWGHDVVGFQTGEDAVEWLREVERGNYDDSLPELAVLDIRLPGSISGIDVCKYLRKTPQLRQIPVIMATAYHLTAAQTEAILAETQADLLLHKPLPSAARFHELLDKLLEEKRVQ